MVNNFLFLQLLNGYFSRIAKCLFMIFRLSAEFEKFENAACCGILKTNHRKNTLWRKIWKWLEKFFTHVLQNICFENYQQICLRKVLSIWLKLCTYLSFFKQSWSNLTFANARKIGRPSRLKFFWLGP